MQVICLEEEAFYALIDTILERVRKDTADRKHKWVSGTEAMQRLGIGKTTLSKLRSEDKIRYSQPQKKVIMYDTDSIDAYLEKHAKEPF